MNSKDNIITLDTAADENLGNALSEGLRRLDSGQCPSHEEIATYIEGKLSEHHKNTLLKHISSCDSCYEMLLLVEDLQKESIPELHNQTKPLFPYKSIALAASIMIVIFAIYIFYTGGVPKTAQELIESDSAAVGKDAPKPQLPSPPGVYASNQKQSTDSKGKKSTELTVLHTKTPSTSQAGEDKGPVKPLQDTTGDSIKEEELKESQEVDSLGATITSTEEKVPQDESSVSPKRGGFSAESKKKTEAAPSVPQPKMKMSSRLDRDLQAKKFEEREQEPSEALSFSRQEEDNFAGQPLKNNIAWSQANLLNMQSQQYRVHIPAQELREMFKQSINLTNQLKESLAKIKQESAQSGDKQKIDAFVQGLTPLIAINTSGDNISVYPNIGYFLSKSEPGSVEHRFFYLARSGYCEPVSGCYGMDKVRNRHARVKLEKVAGKGDDPSENRLDQWKKLIPQLTGIFQEVATNTIAHLEDSKPTE